MSMRVAMDDVQLWGSKIRPAGLSEFEDALRNGYRELQVALAFHDYWE